ncbi:MAG: HDOD domain-containing protein [Desulfobacteraceae bacterium]
MKASCSKPHEGIELDMIDLSSVQNHPDQETPDRPIVELILEKIEETDSFLSFSGQIEELNKILEMRYASAHEIAGVLLKDIALTSKLIKLANSSFYGHFNQKGIGTVSEALIVLGTDLIHQTAANLKLFEFMQQISTSQRLKQKALGCFMRSIIARDLAYSQGLKNYEEFQISAMLFNLGEYITLFFFPEKEIKIEQTAKKQSITKETASRSILGMSYSKIGRTIAEKWGIPDKIIKTMRPVYLFSGSMKNLTDSEYKRYAASFASELTELNWHLSRKELVYNLNEIVERYKIVFKIDLSQARGLYLSSRQKIAEHAKTLNITP